MTSRGASYLVSDRDIRIWRLWIGCPRLQRTAVDLTPSSNTGRCISFNYYCSLHTVLHHHRRLAWPPITFCPFLVLADGTDTTT